MNLNQLIQKCKLQDRAAQKQLYLSYADLVMTVARRYSDEVPESKDIVQNTFIRVFTALEKYDSNAGEFKSWIARICINEAIAIKRKKKRITFVENDVNINDQVADNEAIGKLKGEEIKAVMKSLDSGYQLIMQMYYYDELTTKEIAETLQLKESSVRSKLSRARQKFINHWKMSNSL